MSTRTRPRVRPLATVAALLLAACGGAAAAHSATGPAAPGPGKTTTTAGQPIVAPLTGRPTDAASASRPVLAVKIDNVADAHPQVGINQADVVYEELVEGGATRLMAMFQSTDAGPIGPVRSARPTDIPVFSPLNRPMFAWSGANAWVIPMVEGSNIVNVGATPAVDQYYREHSRVAPHNLFIQGYSSMLESHRDDAGAPPQLFAYRAPDEGLGAGARPVGSVNINYSDLSGSMPVDYVWDASVGGWMRSQGGAPHVDTDGVQVAPPNVVIEFIHYGEMGGIPAGESVGQGSAWILTAGQLVEATWSKPTNEAVTTYSDSAGNPVKLTPGRTWVSLAPEGAATITG